MLARTSRLWLALALVASAAPLTAQERPNVLWIFVEDMNDWYGCYGDETVPTPHVDALAARGVRFTRAYMPAGVCSATRSAMITGAMQTSLGVHHHRSARANFRGKTMGPRYDAIRLPDGVRPAPQVLREAGYYTFNQGKTDYNFVHELGDLYDHNNGGMNHGRRDFSTLWGPAVAQKKPFFGQIQLRGGKTRPERKVADRSQLKVPPYYPDIPAVREEFGHHYDCIASTDREVGRIVAALEKDGLLDSTVVFFFTDHGFRMHRHKQFLYEGGIRVPLVVAGPSIASGVRDDLVSGIDITAATLGLAGVAMPKHVEGRDVFAAGFEPREFLVAARDRCDYSIERIRAVVTGRYKYLRNYLTDRPYMQPQYRDAWAITKQLRAMAAAGELDATQMAFYGDSKPAEELYDLDADPHEVRNLAGDPAHAEALRAHRSMLDGWVESTGDQGQATESEAGLRAALIRWGAKCVNPEYDAPRRAMAKERAGKKKVLILGDSISMGYTPHVTSMLWDEAHVVRPGENCQGTTHGVGRVDEWLQIDGGGFDVIYFNFGLHDLKRVHPETKKNSNNPKHPHQAEPDVYRSQLMTIAKKVKAAGKSVVYATTTPVPPGGVRPHRDIEDVGRYNAIAVDVMGELGIPVHDLNAWVRPQQKQLLPRVDVHFTPEGSQKLAEQVANRMRRALQRSSGGR